MTVIDSQMLFHIAITLSRKRVQLLLSFLYNTVFVPQKTFFLMKLNPNVCLQLCCFSLAVLNSLTLCLSNRAFRDYISPSGLRLDKTVIDRSI